VDRTMFLELGGVLAAARLPYGPPPWLLALVRREIEDLRTDEKGVLEWANMARRMTWAAYEVLPPERMGALDKRFAELESRRIPDSVYPERRSAS
jgi:hypothetical protein